MSWIEQDMKKRCTSHFKRHIRMQMEGSLTSNTKKWMWTSENKEKELRNEGKQTSMASRKRCSRNKRFLCAKMCRTYPGRLGSTWWAHNCMACCKDPYLRVGSKSRPIGLVCMPLFQGQAPIRPYVCTKATAHKIHCSSFSTWPPHVADIVWNPKLPDPYAVHNYLCWLSTNISIFPYCSNTAQSLKYRSTGRLLQMTFRGS